MPYQLDITQTSAYCHATVTGDNSASTVGLYLDELAGICARLECARLLIEENLHGPSFSMSDIYSIVTKAARKVPPTLSKIAFVDANPQHLAANMEFAETVAVNRGVNVRRFATVAEAARWLHGDGESGNSTA